METKLYTSKDLESLSSSELYTKGPDMSSPNVNLPSLTPSLNPGYENPGERLVQVPENVPELGRETYSKPIERQFPSNVGGLENLSASALYTGEPGGGNGGSMKIVDLKESGMQMHLHEGETNQASSVMDYGRNKKLLSSYDAAMGDYYAQKLDLDRWNTGTSEK